MEQGYLAFVLHAHLPYVRHPEYDSFLEEDWYYESITETYLPLIAKFEKLIEDGVAFKITMTLSPTLLSMFEDRLLQYRYLKHINKLIELSHKEIERTRWQPEFNDLAHFYHDLFMKARFLFEEKYACSLINAFKYFQDNGCLEIITCAATHGFLPLMDINKTAVHAQIKTAVNQYKRLFGRKPKGMWLPECGYHPGHEEFLKEEGISYFFVDTHGILHGSPRPKYGIFAPVYCPSGVAAFGRDLESSKQVWSSKEGYPGDFNYRDFYRDIGFDLDYEYIRPYIAACGTRKNTGIKYHKITGHTDYKHVYYRQAALDKAAEHAGNFLFNRQKQAEHLHGFLKKKPIIVSPYDAELFGHWWFEGPEWIDFLIRKIHFDQDTIRMITPSEYLKENPHNQVIEPSMSSWGYKGYNEVWLEGSNDWIYRHLHAMADRMVELANTYSGAAGITERALNQAARELLLAQSSDWAFIMKTGTMVEYAKKRIISHISRFNRLYRDIRSNSINEQWLQDKESKDNLFPKLHFSNYQSTAVKIL
ncbi:MAG: 1,4-alpha-glucan branching protein domain-containing protein [bacterium]